MSGVHWRKAWPERVDNSNDDESVLDFGTTRSEEKPWNLGKTNPWSYDEEVLILKPFLMPLSKLRVTLLVSI